MILHSIHDIIAFMDVSGVKDGIVVGSIGVDSVIDVCVTTIMAIIGLWLIRP